MFNMIEQCLTTDQSNRMNSSAVVVDTGHFSREQIHGRYSIRASNHPTAHAAMAQIWKRRREDKKGEDEAETRAALESQNNDNANLRFPQMREREEGGVLHNPIQEKWPLSHNNYVVPRSVDRAMRFKVFSYL